LLVGLKMLYDLIRQPNELFSIVEKGIGL